MGCTNKSLEMGLQPAAKSAGEFNSPGYSKEKSSKRVRNPGRET
jgi:hypothetical protein